MTKMRYFKIKNSRKLLFFLLPSVLFVIYLSSYIGVGSIKEGENDEFEPEDIVVSQEIVILPPESKNENDPPILIWWTPFTPNKRILRSCSAGQCLVTHSRAEIDNPRTEGVIFYGSNLKWTDLPLPRRTQQYWALLHEESPKNNWGLASPEGISLFNLTSTPSRNSSYPLVTQHLKGLKNLLRPLRTPIEEKSNGDKGLVMFLQLDCDPPSDRDSYIKELMKYIKIDSYGKCLHNKDLPKGLGDPMTGMDSEELLNIISQYKFAIAIENAICDDYITEKFWRPFYAGTVPIVKGSPTIKDWAPSNHSMILIDDYHSPKELAQYLHYLNENDNKYAEYLEYKQAGIANVKLIDAVEKRGWQINDYTSGSITHIDSFECFICNKAIEKRTGLETRPLVANSSHYNCQYPQPLVKRVKTDAWWKDMLPVWRQAMSTERKRMIAITKAIKEGKGQSEVESAYNSVKLSDDVINSDAFQ